MIQAASFFSYNFARNAFRESLYKVVEGADTILDEVKQYTTSKTEQGLEVLQSHTRKKDKTEIPQSKNCPLISARMFEAVHRLHSNPLLRDSSMQYIQSWDLKTSNFDEEKSQLIQGLFKVMDALTRLELNGGLEHHIQESQFSDRNEVVNIIRDTRKIITNLDDFLRSLARKTLIDNYGSELRISPKTENSARTISYKSGNEWHEIPADEMSKYDELCAQTVGYNHVDNILADNKEKYPYLEQATIVPYLYARKDVIEKALAEYDPSDDDCRTKTLDTVNQAFNISSLLSEGDEKKKALSFLLKITGSAGSESEKSQLNEIYSVLLDTLIAIAQIQRKAGCVLGSKPGSYQGRVFPLDQALAEHYKSVSSFIVDFRNALSNQNDDLERSWAPLERQVAKKFPQVDGMGSHPLAQVKQDLVL